MKLSEWAHAAEIASGLVVVVSLIVLIVEVRENIATQRLAAAQQVLGLSYSNNTLVAVDEGANELSLAGLLPVSERIPGSRDLR
jgi:hypothetical protein